MDNTSYEAIKLENQLCFPLYAASREVIKQYHPYLSALDLTYTQYITMMVLWEEKKISVKELGKKLFLDSGTLTPVLKALSQKGFIERHRNTEDERLVIVEITAAGDALKEQAKDVPQKIAGCVKLDTNEAVQLYTLLYKMLETFKEE